METYPEKIGKIEEVSLDYMGENELKLLKTEIPVKWKFSSRNLAYTYEIFKSIDDYQKPVINLKKRLIQ